MDIDPRIKQKPTAFSFYLRLPQHRYFKIEDRIDEIFSPVSKKSPKKSRMAGVFDTPTKLFSTPSSNDTEEKEDSGSSDSSADANGTPKMNVLFGGSSDMMLEYFGGIKFLDKQNEFDATFGKYPVLLPSNLTSTDGTATAKVLLEFSNQCCLDIHLHTCRKFYVGNAKVKKNTSMTEVCQEVSRLSQE